MTLIFGIFIFGLLIFVHELGHFLMAKAFHIKIHAFAIGMGPAVWKKQRGDMEYSLRAFPIGGYVSLEGEDKTSDAPNAFYKQPPLSKIAVLFAGGFMNILAGFLIFLLLFSFLPQINVPIVGEIVQGTVADTSGLMPEDVIVKINHSHIHIQNDVSLALMENGNKPLSVSVRRGKETFTYSLTPQYNEASGTYIIGFRPKTVKMSPVLAVKTAFYNTFFVVRLVYFSLREMVSGHVRLQDVSGPVGIVTEMNAVAKSPMPFRNMLNFMGLIAVNLGVMNLLPIPALDGGRIFFVLVEMIRRKPIKPEHEGLVHFIGFALLMVFMLVVTFSDITKLFA